jgi:uncharacterized membrane protein YfcA
MSVEAGLLTVAFGLVTGILSGLLGVGGGIIMVPYLVLVLGADQHLAEGTSLLVMVPTAIVGAISHGRRGLVNWSVAPMLAIGGAMGAYGGSRLALLTPAGILTKLFAVFLFLVGIRLLLQRPTQQTH